MKVDLPALGMPSRPDVREHAQLELQLALLARLALRELARRAVDARLEVKVSQAALAAARQQRTLAVLGQVRQSLAGVGIDDHRADRHPQFDVLACRPVAVGAATALAVGRLVPPRIAVVDQRVDVAVGDCPDAAAAPAVASVRPALRDELLATKRSAAVAAVAGSDLNGGFVDELHDPDLEKKKPRRERQGFSHACLPRTLRRSARPPARR